MGGKGSGGVKPNQTGRPKKIKQYSDEFKEKVWKALSAEAQKQGKTVYEVFAQRLLNPDKKQPQIWGADFGRLIDILMVKESKTTIEKHEIGPRIGLPPIRHKELESEMPILAPKGLMN